MAMENYKFSSSRKSVNPLCSSGFNSGQERGKKVKRGTLIGLVGENGISNCSTLHFELLKDMKKVDPEIYIDFKILSKDN